MSNVLIKLKEYGSRLDAEMAQSLLGANGINSHLKADDCGGFYTSQSYSIGVELYVNESDYETATDILTNPVNYSDDSGNFGEGENDKDFCESI